MLNRRGLITGLISLVAAPAIVRASNLMPVKMMISSYQTNGLTVDDFLEQIMVADAIMNGESYFKFTSKGIEPISIRDILK
jgi:hypothetical protein